MEVLSKRVAAVVGSRGIRFNLPRQQNFRALDIRLRLPFHGEKLYSCVSPFEGLDSTQRRRLDRPGAKYLNSLISYSLGGGMPTQLYGPYFGAVAHTLYAQVKNHSTGVGRSSVLRSGGGRLSVRRG